MAGEGAVRPADQRPPARKDGWPERLAAIAVGTVVLVAVGVVFVQCLSGGWFLS